MVTAQKTQTGNKYNRHNFHQTRRIRTKSTRRYIHKNRRTYRREDKSNRDPLKAVYKRNGKKWYQGWLGFILFAGLMFSSLLIFALPIPFNWIKFALFVIVILLIEMVAYKVMM